MMMIFQGVVLLDNHQRKRHNSVRLPLWLVSQAQLWDGELGDG